MKFYIEKLLIWERTNSETEAIELPFEPNKVNVITGGNNTGKTCILKIIDYCLFGKINDIPDDVNDKISYYGLLLQINDKKITIGRSSISSHGEKTSGSFYFSKDGHIPQRDPNLLTSYLVREKEIKSFLEKEYGITEDYELIKVGTKIKEGSKLRLEYFSIFNTISQNLILDEKNFFDFQLNNRDRQLYQEVLDSIFDLCIGLSSKEAYEIRKEIANYEHKLRVGRQTQDRIGKKIAKNETFIKGLIAMARKLELVDDEIDEENLPEALSILEKRINTGYSDLKKLVEPDDYKVLEEQRQALKRKIKSLTNLKKEIEIHNQILKEREDSLKPIEYLFNSTENLINANEIADFVSGLSRELQTMRDSLDGVPKSKANIEKEINDLANELLALERQMERYPKKSGFVNINERNLTLIETRVQIKNFIEQKPDVKDEDVLSLEDEIKFFENKLDELNSSLPEDLQGEQYRRINLLNNLVQKHYDIVKVSLDNYSDYRVEFNYKKKSIDLLKSGDDRPSSISGSSNYLFLHLCLFLGLHELFISKKRTTNYVPQFLIIDYPSLPYKSNESNLEDDGIANDSDRDKLRNVFELLNNFINLINVEYKEDFQVIILEHVNSEIWETPTLLENFHLVKQFRNGNSLLGF